VINFELTICGSSHLHYTTTRVEREPNVNSNALIALLYRSTQTKQRQQRNLIFRHPLHLPPRRLLAKALTGRRDFLLPHSTRTGSTKLSTLTRLPLSRHRLLERIPEPVEALAVRRAPSSSSDPVGAVARVALGPVLVESNFPRRWPRLQPGAARAQRRALRGPFLPSLSLALHLRFFAAARRSPSAPHGRAAAEPDDEVHRRAPRRGRPSLASPPLAALDALDLSRCLRPRARAWSSSPGCVKRRKVRPSLTWHRNPTASNLPLSITMCPFAGCSGA